MRTALFAAPLLLAATAAFAQDASTLQGLAACRTDAATVDLTFSYSGSACEVADFATVTEDGETATVVVPTEATAEVCTMQEVAIDVAQSIPVTTAVRTLDVELLDVQGEVSRTGTTEIAPQCTEA